MYEGEGAPPTTAGHGGLSAECEATELIDLLLFIAGNREFAPWKDDGQGHVIGYNEKSVGSEEVYEDE